MEFFGKNMPGKRRDRHDNNEPEIPNHAETPVENGNGLNSFFFAITNVVPANLLLRRGRYRFRRLKTTCLVGAVTERSVLRGTAATQSDILFSGRVELISQMIEDRNGSGNEKWTIFASFDCDFRHVSFPANFRK